MKSYELIRPAKFQAGEIEGFEKFSIYPDPKREGLYMVSVSISVDNYKAKWSHLYGKCNQSKIQLMIDEINS